MSPLTLLELTFPLWFKKGDANGHHKAESITKKHYFWINKLAVAAILDFFKVPVVLFVRQLVMQKASKSSTTSKPWYASGWNYEVILSRHKLRWTNVIEMNYRAKIANKTTNINVQNRSLYTLVNGGTTHQKQQISKMLYCSALHWHLGFVIS